MIMNNYNLGDVFQDDEEYSARAEYANINWYLIKEIEAVNDVRRFQICEIAKPTFAELQNAKYETLSSVSSKYQAWNWSDMYVTSSLGFKVNADQCSQNNISVLIGLLDDESTTSFKLYDNTFKVLNKSQLQTLLKECQQNSLALYQQKFEIQAEIAKATTKEELDAIVIDFVNADYSL